MRGDVVAVGLTPDRLALGLDAADGTKNGDRPIQNAKRSLDFHREVDVSRRIDDVDVMLVPIGIGRSGRNGNAALTLLLHPVHDGGTLMDLAGAVDSSRVIENPLRERGLTGIDVSHDADIANFIECVLPRHVLHLFQIECERPPAFLRGKQVERPPTPSERAQIAYQR